MNEIRKLRIQANLQKVIVEIIAKACGTVASVSSVSVTPNLKYAQVHLFPFKPDINFSEIEKIVRSKLQSSKALNYIPKLAFIWENSLTDNNKDNNKDNISNNISNNSSNDNIDNNASNSNDDEEALKNENS